MANFTQGNVPRQLITFALPLYLSNILQIIYNVVDMIIVGQTLGKVGLSAVAIGGDVTAFLTFFSMGFSGASMVGQNIGAKKFERVTKILQVIYLPLAILFFFGSAVRSPMNALINGSGNYVSNFLTALFDGIILRIGLALLFCLEFEMNYLGFWLGDALAGFTPLVIGMALYFSGKWRQ